MADIPASAIFMPLVGLVAGVVVGWVVRSVGIRKEKDALHDGWKERLATQKAERDRVAEQNRNLMAQVSQYRNSRKEADKRAGELSDLLRESKARCERLEKQRDEARREAESSVSPSPGEETERLFRARMREKDEKIFKMSRELESWRNRLPPLLDKYRERCLQLEQLEIELETVTARLGANEDRNSNDTRIEPMEDAALAALMDASNEQFEEGGGTHVDIELAADDGDTGIDAVLDEGTVDFDLGAKAAAGSSEEPDAADLSISEVFNEDASTAEVDEVLEAGQTPTTDAVAPDAGTTPDEAGAASVSGNGDGRYDDLQQINGVGPDTEKRLNELGFHSFDQIAEMSEADIDRVARELHDVRPRIYREDWIGQARLLQHDGARRLQ